MNRDVSDAGQAELVIVLPDLGAGGAQRVATAVANHFADSGVRTAVVLDSPGGAARFELVPAVALYELQAAYPDLPRWARRLVLPRALSFAGLLRRVRELRGLLGRLQPRVVVAFIAATNITTIMATAGLPLRVVISERNDPARQSNGLFWDVMRRLAYRFADVVTANSHGVLTTMSAYVPPGRLEFLPNPLVPPGTGSVERPPASVLAVGRLVEQKGYDVLLEAFAQVLQRVPGARLTVLGDGPLREPLEALSRRLGIENSIDWRGVVTATDEYLARHAIFALASRFEGMPNALLEAMAAGLAVVVTDASPGPLELVEEGISGLVVPVDDAGALADAICRLATDDALRAGLAEHARQVTAEFAPGPVMRRWGEVLQLNAAVPADG